MQKAIERFFQLSLLGLVSAGSLAVAGFGFLDTLTVIFVSLHVCLPQKLTPQRIPGYEPGDLDENNGGTPLPKSKPGACAVTFRATGPSQTSVNYVAGPQATHRAPTMQSTLAV